MRRINKALLITLILLAISYISSTSVQAAEKNIKATNLEVIVHRLVVPSNSIIIENRGNTIENSPSEELKGVNEVRFSIYDITRQLDEKLAEGYSIEESQLALIRTSFDFSTVQPIYSAITSSINGEDGVASFSLMTTPEKKQAFLIKEISSPENVTVKADQMVLITPLYSKYGDVMSNVHLYPKNITKKVIEEPTLVKNNLELPKINGVKNILFFPQTGETFQTEYFQLGLILMIFSISGVFVYRKNDLLQ